MFENIVKKDVLKFGLIGSEFVILHSLSARVSQLRLPFVFRGHGRRVLWKIAIQKQQEEVQEQADSEVLSWVEKSTVVRRRHGGVIPISCISGILSDYGPYGPQRFLQ